MPVMRLWAALDALLIPMQPRLRSWVGEAVLPVTWRMGLGQGWERARCPATASFFVPIHVPRSVGINVVGAYTSSMTDFIPMVGDEVAQAPLHWINAMVAISPEIIAATMHVGSAMATAGHGVFPT